MISKFLKDALTDVDGLSYDFLRILACLGVLVYFALAIANWKSFDAVAYGLGFGSVLLAAGGAVRLNEGPKEGQPVAGPTTVVTGASNVSVNP